MYFKYANSNSRNTVLVSDIQRGTYLKKYPCRVGPYLVIITEVDIQSVGQLIITHVDIQSVGQLTYQDLKVFILYQQ